MAVISVQASVWSRVRERIGRRGGVAQGYASLVQCRDLVAGGPAVADQHQVLGLPLGDVGQDDGGGLDVVGHPGRGPVRPARPLV